MNKMMENTTKERKELVEVVYNLIKDYTNPEFERVVKQSINVANLYSTAKYFELTDRNTIIFYTESGQKCFENLNNSFEEINGIKYIKEEYIITKYGLSYIKESGICREGIKLLVVSSDNKTFEKDIRTIITQANGVINNLDELVAYFDREIKSFIEEIKSQYENYEYVFSYGTCSINGMRIPMILADVINEIIIKYINKYNLTYKSKNKDLKSNL